MGSHSSIGPVENQFQIRYKRFPMKWRLGIVISVLLSCGAICAESKPNEDWVLLVGVQTKADFPFGDPSLGPFVGLTHRGVFRKPFHAGMGIGGSIGKKRSSVSFVPSFIYRFVDSQVSPHAGFALGLELIINDEQMGTLLTQKAILVAGADIRLSKSVGLRVQPRVQYWGSWSFAPQIGLAIVL